MASVEAKSFDAPDETREFQGNGRLDVVHIHGQQVGRGTFEPGWTWENNVKPIAGTDSCRTFHFGYVLSGRMKITMDDGTEAECGPGDVMAIDPGHTGEVLGDEPCVTLEFGEAGTYAKPQ